MGFSILHKRRLLIAFLTALVSCNRETEPEQAFRIEPTAFQGQTKSLLAGSGIETKITGVTLAAYSRGRLYRCTYTSGNGSSIPFKLENGETYNVYALANTGDSRSLFPEYESDVPDLEYRLTSYNSGSNSVQDLGIPMAGKATGVSGGGNPGAIGVQRLLARVSAHIECTWPGASVQTGLVGNMNGRLLPFGESAMEGPGDVFSFEPEKHVVSGGTSADLVLYVPENIQGTVSGITSPEGKSHEKNASVEAIKDRLTYLEVLVSGTALYEGEIRYRSYLGANATDNFDIVRNCTYNWTLTYGEDGLGTDDWKKDNGLEDLRVLQTTGPLYVIPGESVSLTDYFSTNMPLNSLEWSVGPNLKRNDMFGAMPTSGTPSGVCFTIDSNYPPYSYGNRVVNISPLANQRQGLGGNMNIYVVDEQIAWKSVLGGKYYVTPGRQVDGEADFYVTYFDDEQNALSSVHIKGLGGKRWNYTGGICPTLLGDIGKEYDIVRFSPLPTTLPGDYLVSATTRDGTTANATVHVNDTRSIRWIDRSSDVPAAANGFIAYRYLSENKIVVFLGTGGRYSTSSGQGFSLENTPLGFIAGDRSIKTADLSQTAGGVPFEGALLLGNNYHDRIGMNYSSSMANKTVGNLQNDGKTMSGNLLVVPKVNTNLANATTYTFTVNALNGYDDATRHSIEAHIRVGSGALRELVLTPAISKVTAGASVTLTPVYYTFNVSEDEINVEESTVLSAGNSRLTWNGAPGGVFTASEPGNYRISATYTYGGISCTGYADIEVTSSDVGVWSDWDSNGSITLD